MAQQLVDTQTGEVLNEVQLLDRRAELKRQIQDLSNQVKDLDIQLLKYMFDLNATKRKVGNYNVTVATNIKREFSEKFNELVNVIGPDRFIEIVKVTPKWLQVRELIKEGGAVREIVETSLTETPTQTLKIERIK